jgi:hypothetical protein
MSIKEKDDDLFQDSGIDLDNVDLRSLAARGKAEHLRLVVNEQRRRYTYLIEKGLEEQNEARKLKRRLVLRKPIHQKTQIC